MRRRFRRRAVGVGKSAGGCVRRSVVLPRGAATHAPRHGEPVGGGRGGVAGRVDLRGEGVRRIPERRLPAFLGPCMGVGGSGGMILKGGCRGLSFSALWMW